VGEACGIKFPIPNWDDELLNLNDGVLNLNKSVLKAVYRNMSK